MSGSYEDEKWEQRRQIEALHAKTPSGRDFNILTAALGPTRDKVAVLRIAGDVLKSLPIEKDGVFSVGNIEITFDDESNLVGISSVGGIVIGSKSRGDS